MTTSKSKLNVSLVIDKQSINATFCLNSNNFYDHIFTAFFYKLDN